MNKIIEMIWPMLEGEPSNYDNFLSDDVEVNDDNLDDILSFSRQMYQSQKDRVATIESKSIVYVGFFGAVIAVLAFVIKDVLMANNESSLNNIALLVGGIISIYILQIMRFSIKAMERKEYASLDEEDFLTGSKKDIAIKIINKTKKNYNVINVKVDNMAMAHEFTKRLIWILCIVSSGLVLYAALKLFEFEYVNSTIIYFKNINFSRYDLMFFFLFLGFIINHFKIKNIKKK